MRGRNYSPSLPRDYGRRYRSPSPRGCYGDRSRDLPTSLLVRNLRHDCRVEDLRGPLGQFGHLKDIYLPRDNYTGEPCGFGLSRVGQIGTPRFIILDNRDVTEVSSAVQIIIVLLGKGITQGQFHPEMGDVEGDPTQGRPIVGAGVKVWTILGFLPGFDEYVVQHHS
ncbi:Serine/arginine-rich splicing factor 10 [Gossypium arboreum]|uniref:Serine/arginine-rich splicing factor 10 n=1 Tax=Gossypium arboreum TaxID=29729 RepID=A0A0B0MFH6_GOSAR|nr:Serine/arginine-rich splicing factor 10 [Gossypium arboreum]